MICLAEIKINRPFESKQIYREEDGVAILWPVNEPSGEKRYNLFVALEQEVAM